MIADNSVLIIKKVPFLNVTFTSNHTFCASFKIKILVVLFMKRYIQPVASGSLLPDFLY
jgi:hypothetical protein